MVEFYEGVFDEVGLYFMVEGDVWVVVDVVFVKCVMFNFMGNVLCFVEFGFIVWVKIEFGIDGVVSSEV